MFKRNGVYFLLTSGATGWSPNQQKYSTATQHHRPLGDADGLRRPTGYRSQTDLRR